VAELARLGYTPNSASGQMFVRGHVSRWLAAQGLDACGLTPQVTDRFLAARRRAGCRLYLSLTGLAPLLGYLRRLGAVPPAPPPVPASPAEALPGRYFRSLVTGRGLTAVTARGYAGRVRPFVAGWPGAVGWAGSGRSDRSGGDGVRRGDLPGPGPGHGEADRDRAGVAAGLTWLATYLGHVDPAATYWYLTASPELMAAAGQRLDAWLEQS